MRRPKLPFDPVIKCNINVDLLMFMADLCAPYCCNFGNLFIDMLTAELYISLSWCVNTVYSVQ